MLWIGGQITSVKVVLSVLLPSLVCLLVPLIMTSRKVKGHVTPSATDPDEMAAMAPSSHRNLVMTLGIAALLFVPAFKTFTHLPPFMGMLISLGVMWIVTEMIHHGRDEADKHKLSVNFALRKIDTPSILFFLGILLSVGALQSIGSLTRAAGVLSDAIGNENLIVISIGLLSSVVDNVPLVAAAQGMYSVAQYPTDDFFWHFMAYCTGTGGSVLIIGSAAGVAAMGIEKIEFFWYLKRISLLALCGYLAGAGFFILQNMISGRFI
jgi:Na+/H+ antiporter NhaD/arsenite permease-like protein